MKAVILIGLIIFAYILIPTTVDVKKTYANYFVPNNTALTDELRITYLGVSSFLIQDKHTTLLIDAFLTRPNKFQLLFKPLQSNTQQIRTILKQLNINTIDAIFTLHSHHDHAMDIGFIAQQTHANIIASSSTLNIAKAYDLETHQLQKIEGKTQLKLGEFTITLIPSQHTKMGTILSQVVGLDKTINKVHTKKEYLDAFKEGGTYSIHIQHPKHTFFINGSTGYKANMTQGLQAQTVFLGIAKLGKQPPTFKQAYYDTLVTQLHAKKVVPIHWDDFTKDFDTPITPLPFMFDDFESSMDFLIQKTQADGIQLQVMDFFDTMVLNSKPEHF